MKAFFDLSVIRYESIDSRMAFRAQVAARARRITDALMRAADAAHEMNVAGAAKTRARVSGTERARQITERQLRIAMVAQLKECASVAHEMQLAINDVLVGWVLSDDIAGTGLGRDELGALLDVAGYRQ